MTTAYYMANIASLKDTYKCNTCKGSQNGESGIDEGKYFHDSSSTQDTTQGDEIYRYVTQRKPRQNASLEHHESLLDLSYQSLPNISTQNYQEQEDLKMENQNLKQEIEVAHLEIENLNSENMDLRKKNTELQTKVTLFKSIGLGDINNRNASTPRKYYSPQFRKIRPDLMKIGFPSTSLNDLTQNVIKQIDGLPSQTTSRGKESQIQNLNITQSFETITRKLEKQIIITVTREKAVENVNENKQLNKETTTRKNATILPNTVSPKIVKLFTDERGRGLRTTLQQQMGQDFCVAAEIKPNAPLAEIVKTTGSDCKNFTDKDFVVIIAGSNDKDPLDMQSMLYSGLKALTHTNVVLCSVGKTRHLNENMTNQCFKYISSRFSNVTFLEVYEQSSKYNRTIFHKQHASKMLLKELLRLDYKKAYEKYSKTKKPCDINKTEKINLVTNETQTDNEGFRVGKRDEGTQTNENEFFRV